jgi:hypothetical protein
VNRSVEILAHGNDEHGLAVGSGARTITPEAILERRSSISLPHGLNVPDFHGRGQKMDPVYHTSSTWAARSLPLTGKQLPFQGFLLFDRLPGNGPAGSGSFPPDRRSGLEQAAASRSRRTGHANDPGPWSRPGLRSDAHRRQSRIRRESRSCRPGRWSADGFRRTVPWKFRAR